MDSMKVRFVWFWSTFNPENNFFLDILQMNYEKIEVIRKPNEPCDLEIVSCFVPIKDPNVLRIKHLIKNLPHGQPDINLIYPKVYDPKTKNFKRRVWYGPENLRPPYQKDLDGTLSFEQDTLGGFNAYCPNWYELSGIVGPYFNPRVGRSIKVEQLLESRELESGKTKFACAFIGKADQMRFRAVRELARIGKIDVFGPIVGKPVKSKFEISKDYKYMLCFENDIYPGYVTEKPLEAYLAKTVPLYWGQLDRGSPINEKGLINLNNFDSMQDWVEYIASLGERGYQKIYEQPFLNRVPDLNAVTKILAPQ
jgi:hypothetical protein